jgi:hypothetical protein
MRPFLTTLAALIAAPLLALAPAAPVHADGGDEAARLNKNCIDYREFKTMEGGTMRQIEAANDATGKVIHTQRHGRVLLKQYHWCGHPAYEGFFQISYYGASGHRIGQYVLLFDFTVCTNPNMLGCAHHANDRRL